MRSEPLEVSVIIPLLQGQGKELVCLRSWMQKQSFPRSRYQVILATTGADPELDRQAEALLQPQDRLLRSTGSVHQLYQDAARSAEGRVLFFTELHCHAHRDCLAAMAQWLQDHPHMAGGCARSTHANLGPLSELIEKLFETDMAEWHQPGHWKRVQIRGVAIRKHIYDAVGGHEGELNFFADVVLAARLHRAGHRLEMVEAARIVHRNTTNIAEVCDTIREQAEGEQRFRLRSEALQWESYLGLPEPWAATLAERQEDPLADARRLARLLGWRAMHNLILLGLIAGKLIQGVLGRRWRVRLLGLQAWRQRCCYRLLKWAGAANPFPYFLASWRLAIHQALVRVALRAPLPLPTAVLPAGAVSVQHIPLAAWSGIHALEKLRGAAFRWTKPVFKIRWLLPADGPGWEITLTTAGIRPSPRSLIVGAFWNGQVIPPADIHDDGDAIRLQVGPANSQVNELMVVCVPLLPRWLGRADPRNLGLPVAQAAIHPRTQTRQQPRRPAA